MVQKKFIDIERVKFNNEISNGNCFGFIKGDSVYVQEKIDGSNASIRYDEETNLLVAFSRKQMLNSNKTLGGFWNYVQTLNIEEFKDYPNLIIFGEWMVKNHIIYSDDIYKRWIVYDIYDTEQEVWLPQVAVKNFCKCKNLEYIHNIYIGEFTTWNDFIEKFKESKSYYSDVQAEGFIVKNQTKLNNINSREPFVLKFVNDSYSEINKSNHIKKMNPQEEEEKQHAQEIVNTIVTRRRIEKEIHKMIDEGILPNKIEPKDIKIIAQNLPKRIYDDCVKEENEYIIEAGKCFNKLCSTKCIKLAKEIIFE